jgi:hypothetical protein
MARHANATSFKPGDRANPKGRPPGIKETLPRGAFKAAYDRVLAKHPELLDTVIRAGLQGQPKARNAVPFLELGAKLGKEIGADAAHDTRPVVFHFHTNLNPMALDGPQSPMRRILDGESSRGVGAPGLPAQGGGRRRLSEDQ